MMKLITAVSLVAALAINDAHAGPSDPETRPEDWWWWNHDQFVANTASNPNIPIIFYGDSITQGWANEGLSVFNRYYAPLGAVNYAIGGDKTEHVLWRMLNGEITGLNPKLVVLEIGVNNLFGGTDENVATADGVKTVVATLRQMLPNTKILLLGLLPCCGEWGYENIVEINGYIQPLHNATTVYYVDMIGAFSDGWGQIREEYFTDGVHLTTLGYQKWADTMNPLFNQLVV